MTLKPKELKAIEHKSDDNEKQLKYKDVFNELSNQRIGGEIYNTSNKINLNHLNYHFNGSNTASINFSDVRGSMYISTEVKNGNTSI